MSLAVHGKLLAGSRTLLPTDLSALRIWADANTLIPSVADGGGVSSFGGAAGTTAFAQASGPAQPLFRLTGGLGGRPCVEFDGVAFFMNTAAIAAFDNSNTVSALIVMQEITFNSGRTLSSHYAGGLSGQNADVWGYLYNSATQPSGYFRRADSTSDASIATIVAATWHVYALSVSGTSVTLSCDGVTSPSVLQTQGTPTTHISTYLGKRQAGNFANVRVAEVAVWSACHGMDKLNAVARGMKRKWGTP